MENKHVKEFDNFKINERVVQRFNLRNEAEFYTSKILGYEKQKFPSDEWEWIEDAYVKGYNDCLKRTIENK